MFPVDTTDFCQTFLHIKQIIRPSESQPYTKKQENSIDTIDSSDNLQQKYRYYRYQMFSLLAITSMTPESFYEYFNIPVRKNCR